MSRTNEAKKLIARRTPEQQHIINLYSYFNNIPDSVLLKHFDLCAGETRENKILNVIAMYPEQDIAEEVPKMKHERNLEYIKELRQQIRKLGDCDLQFCEISENGDEITIHIGKPRGNN